jgi:hypothetical protein
LSFEEILEQLLAQNASLTERRQEKETHEEYREYGQLF